MALALGRKPGQAIVIGEIVTVKIVKVRGQLVTVAIEAPREVSIRRAELEPKERKGAA